jgi:Large eukaryotic DNA virus major capsid protein/Major capsid protein N-terminus
LMDAWMELTTQLGIKNSLYTMTGKQITFNKNSQTGTLKLLIPLPFWLTRSMDRALPLISMQYIDVKIVIQFKTFDKCWWKLTDSSPILPVSITKANLICDFVYLDVFERQKMAANPVFEYLIEQFQIAPVYNIQADTINYTARLFFNHPVKELIWMYRSYQTTAANDYYNYANILNYYTPSERRAPPFNTLQLKFNGNDRFEMLPYTYFTLYEPYRVHSCGTSQYIHAYSFALNPESVQPSGTCNFSKLDNVSMNFSCTPNIQDGEIYIFATNYNILRIQSGMAGLMFSS